MTKRLYHHLDENQENVPQCWNEDEVEHQWAEGEGVVSETTPLADKSLEAGVKKIVDSACQEKADVATSSFGCRVREEGRRTFTLGFSLGGCVCLFARRTAFFLSRTFFPTSPEGRPYRQLSMLRFLLITIVSLPILLVVMVLAYGGVPPSYHEVKLRERALPQHDWTRGTIEGIRHSSGENMDPPRGGDSKYVRFPDHLWGHGLNNVLQEALLQALIAYHSNRSYVFEDFVWSHIPLPYTLYDFSLRPTRVPMGEFLSGWIAGERVFNDANDNKETNYGRRTHLDDMYGKMEREQGGKRRRGPVSGQIEHDCGNNPCSLLVPTTPGCSTSDPTTTSHSVHFCRSKDTFFATEATQTQNTDVPLEFQRKYLPLAGVNNSQQSVSAEYFEHVCPPSQRVEVVYRWPRNTLSADSPAEHADGSDILRWWIQRLSRDDLKDEKCIVIREGERRVWDSNFFGTRRPLSLFPLLRDSPILTNFRWAKIVNDAVERSISRQFQEAGPSDSILYSQRRTGDAPHSDHEEKISDPRMSNHHNVDRSIFSSGVVPGLVAIHLRRGDYKRHCTRLAQWKSGYMGWNRLIDGRDGANTFDEELASYMAFRSSNLASDGGLGDEAVHVIGSVVEEEDSDALQDESIDADIHEQASRRTQFYLEHCLPTIPQVVRRLREIRECYSARLRLDDEDTGPSSTETSRMGNPLTQVYVLTNGWPSFLENLRQALLADGWDRVVGSADLEGGHTGQDGVSPAEDDRGFSREEKGVSAAIDMGIAERAELFVGNGFSSLSANVVMFRLAKGLPYHSNQLL